MEQFERVMPKNERDLSTARLRLVRAGYRNESTLKVFQGSKVFLPLVLCIILLVTGIGRYSPFFLYACALGLGYLGPDLWLGRMISTRQKRIRRALPDVLDLMIICIEAGLSLDQSVVRTSQELQVAQPELCDELGVVVLEQAAGRPRADAWKNLADRTDVDSVRALVSILVQAEKFGTSIARTLRIHSDTLRTRTPPESRGAGGQNNRQTGLPPSAFHLPVDLSGNTRARNDQDVGIFQAFFTRKGEISWPIQQSSG